MVQVFASVADAVPATITDDWVQTLAYSTPAAGGGALYRRDTAQRPGSFQNTPSGVWFSLVGDEISVESCGASVNYAAALKAAVERAAQLGAWAVHERAAVYDALGTIALSDVDIRLRGNGATIRRNTPITPYGPLLDVRYGFSSVVPVTLTEVAKDISGSGIVTDVVEIHFASLADWNAMGGFAAGDVVKLFSDTTILHVTGRTERYGEIVEIALVDAANLKIWTYKPLRVELTSNPRATKLQRKACEIEGLTFIDVPGSALRHDSQMLQIMGAVEPKTRNLAFRDVTSSCLSYESCFRPTSTGNRFERARTDETANTFGYGLIEYGCTDGSHFDLHALDVRHCYTTGAHDRATPWNPATDGPATVYQFGGVVGTRIFSSHAIDTQNSGFDTHEDAVDVGFIGCAVVQNFQGPSASYHAYKLRGRDCFMTGCHSTGSGAVDLVADGTGGGNFVVRNHIHYRPEGYPRGDDPVSGSGSQTIARLRSDDPAATMTLELDAYVEEHPTRLIWIENCDVTIPSLKLDWRSNGSTDYDAGLMTLKSAAKVHVESLDVDLRRGALHSPFIAGIEDAAASFHCEKARIRLSADTNDRYILGNLRAAGTQVAGRITFAKVDATRAADIAGAFFGVGAGATAWAYLVTADGTGAQNFIQTPVYSNLGATSITFAARSAPRILVLGQLNAAGTKPMTIDTPPVNVMQELLISNAVASTPTATFGIANSASLPLSVTVSLAPGQALLCVAAGTVWRPVSKMTL